MGATQSSSAFISHSAPRCYTIVVMSKLLPAMCIHVLYVPVFPNCLSWIGAICFWSEVFPPYFCFLIEIVARTNDRYCFSLLFNVPTELYLCSKIL